MTAPVKSNELQSTLDTLLRLHARGLEGYELKRLEVSRVRKELSDAGMLIDHLTGTIRILQGQLGIPESDRLPSRFVGRLVRSRPVVKVLLEIIAEHDAKGGILRKDLFKIAKDQGVDSADDYMKAVLYRLQRRDGKIRNDDHRWLLTDKGKAALGIDVKDSASAETPAPATSAQS